MGRRAEHATEREGELADGEAGAERCGGAREWNVEVTMMPWEALMAGKVEGGVVIAVRCGGALGVQQGIGARDVGSGTWTSK